jgi:aminoglycoside phosphotransferase (APT) family kinase protein
VERVGAGLEQLAHLHGKSSGANPMERYPWGVPHIRPIVLNMLSEGEWSKRFAPEAAPPVPEAQTDRVRMKSAFESLWRQTPILTTFIHADCHSGNTFLNEKGEPGFLDWQGPHVGAALHDVAYFLTGALTIENRRANERALVEQYLKALHAAGGPKLTLEEVWKEYQYRQVYGFVWPLSGPLMQPKEIVDEMSRRHGAAIEDHKSLEILEAMADYVKVE